MEEMFTDSVVETGVEEPEVAEPVSEEGAEETEVAEPSGRTEADSAFAELRRRAEEAERRAQEAEQNSSQMQEALGLYFEGETPTDLAINARANAYGVDPDQERARFQAELERSQFEQENETLKYELEQMRVERLMEQGLAEVRAIDPSINDLTDLGVDFPNFIMAGLSSTDAYYACKAKEARTKITPPKPIGSVESAGVESGFFSREEVDAMSDEEIDKNYEAIRNSMNKWK